MTLSNLIQQLKGGSGSGNHGHAGIPGSVGGSAAGTAITFYNETNVLPYIRDKESQLIAKHFNISNDEAKEFIGRTFSYKDEATGYSTNISGLNTDNDQLVIMGTIDDANGNQVGHFTRAINPDKTVNHLAFSMNESAQGSGFGSSFYKHAEASYEKAGVKAVSMTANLTVGGYAWARMGFNYSAESKPDVEHRFQQTYRARYGVPPSHTPSTAYEMAASIGPDGHRIGKEALLGSSWVGTKNLNVTDLGYQVGQEYYKTKGKK